jgi:hypothetical protein
MFIDAVIILKQASLHAWTKKKVFVKVSIFLPSWAATCIQQPPVINSQMEYVMNWHIFEFNLFETATCVKQPLFVTVLDGCLMQVWLYVTEWAPECVF